MHTVSENAALENSISKSIKKDPSLRQRLMVIDIMVPGTALFAMIGGWPFTIFVMLVLCVAGWEFWRIFTTDGHKPSLSIILVSVVSATILRHLFGLLYMDIWLTVLVMAAMLIHIIHQQTGDQKAASSFAMTVCGAVYFGLFGSFAISMRMLDNGLYWAMLVFPVISIADAGAYVFGILFGKHKILTVVSPKKSWEGYFGGILVGALGGWGLGALWHIPAPDILPIHGLLIGIALSIFAPIGDFGESMIKRQYNIKDSSNILPGHGGFFDRIDSSLWAAVLGYYLVLMIR